MALSLVNQIKLGETYLPLPTRELVEWQKRFLPLRKVVRPYLTTTNAVNSWDHFGHDWEPELGKLYWPTGSRRCALGFFVASKKNLESNVFDGSLRYHSHELILGDPASAYQSVMFRVLVLPPIPIAYTDAEGNNLHLIVVTDDRYYWATNFIPITTPEYLAQPSQSQSSWGNLFSSIPNYRLSSPNGVDRVVPNGTVVQGLSSLQSDAKYGDAAKFRFFDPNAFGDSPNIAWHSPLNSVADIIDVSSRSTGRRMSLRYDLTMWIQTPSESLATLTTNRERTFKRLSGADGIDTRGETAFRIVPEFVSVHFPFGHVGSGVFFTHGGPQPAKIVSRGPPSITDKLINPFHIKTIVETYPASTPYGVARVPITPTNLADLEELAQRIAMDEWDWAIQSYDISFAGICDWTPCGHDDVIEFTYQQEMVSTRVRSTRPDTNVETMYHAPVSAFRMYYGELWECQLASPLNRGGVAFAYVRQRERGDDGEWIIDEDGPRIIVHDNEKIPECESPIPEGKNITAALTQGDYTQLVVIAWERECESSSGSETGSSTGSSETGSSGSSSSGSETGTGTGTGTSSGTGSSSTSGEECVPCAPCCLPRTLTITITDGPGGFCTLQGNVGTFELVWNGIDRWNGECRDLAPGGYESHRWVAFITGTTPCQITVQEWLYAFDGCAGVHVVGLQAVIDIEDCDPLFGDNVICNGGTITITE